MCVRVCVRAGSAVAADPCVCVCVCVQVQEWLLTRVCVFLPLQVQQWLLTLTAKVMCEWRSRSTRDDRLEHVLVHTLLCRVTFADLSEALLWLRRRV